MIKLVKVLLLTAIKPTTYRSSLVTASVQYSIRRQNQESLSPNKNQTRLKKSPQKSQRSISIKEDDLVVYITSKKRTLEELLNIDVRSFPAEHRLTCLEAIIQTARQQHIMTLPEKSNVLPATYSINSYHSASMSFDRFTEVSAISLGIDPTSTAAMGFLPPLNPSMASGGDTSFGSQSLLMDERFKLLLYSSVSGAKDLSRPRLLVLAACLRQIPTSSSQSKALASVLRLITLQINESSPSELVYMGSLLSGLPRQPNTDNTETASSTLTVLGVEADLMRDALRRHLMNRLPEMESLGLMPLLRLGYDFGAELAYPPASSKAREIDKLRFLSVIETVLSTRPKEQNLYTTCLLYATMQRMNAMRSGLINRGLGQIRRKLHLTNSYPQTDQSAWLSGSLAALAYLSVGGSRVPSSLFNISQFSRLPLETRFLNREEFKSDDAMTKYWSGDQKFIGEPGLDIHQHLMSDWVRQLLFDVADYVAERTEACALTAGSLRNTIGEKTGGPVVGSALAAVRTCLALLLLGVRHEKLINICTRFHLVSADFTTFVDLHLTQSSDVLVSKLAQPPTRHSEFVWTDLVHSLPRADWQLYYELARMQMSGLVHPSFNESVKSLFRDYIMLKQTAVGSFITQLQARLASDTGIEIFPFHLVEIDNEYLFADIIIRKQSSVDPTISKYVLCFLTWQRDVLISAPMGTLISAYSKNTSLPVLPFVYCDSLALANKNRLRDEFLKHVGEILMTANGVPTATAQVHPLKEFIGKV